MDFVRATAEFEKWLSQNIKIVKDDLELKHTRMDEGLFPFLRATFYRWAQVWPKVCESLAGAPKVLSVGDLHVENFGTWRDLEGRLAWGINDFDEAYELPYTNDLVRLATSAALAIHEGRLAVKLGAACDAILDGYRKTWIEGPHSFVLAERSTWLHDLAIQQLRDPARFWEKFDALPSIKPPISPVAKLLRESLPDRKLKCRVAHRIAGLGSLGHQRFVAIGNWQGGLIAREVKALRPSAAAWAKGAGSVGIKCAIMLRRCLRPGDPSVRVQGAWIVRRLAPDCAKIELAEMPQEKDELRLLHAMGRETGTIHLADSRASQAIRRDLKKREGKHDWLLRAVEKMVEQVDQDWRSWRKR